MSTGRDYLASLGYAWDHRYRFAFLSWPDLRIALTSLTRAATGASLFASPSSRASRALRRP